MPSNEQKPLIGISACLTGEAVRYDGQDKRQPRLLAILSPHAELRPFCPEVAAGLGVPRPPVHLIQTSRSRVRALGLENPELDVTTALSQTASEFSTSELEGLSGFLLKSRSPSCGLTSTPIHAEDGTTLQFGSGLFAAALKNAAPWLPCVEESALTNEESCLRFLSACALVARHRHGLERYAELDAWLATILHEEGMSPDKRLQAIVAHLLTPHPSRQNDEAALGERLREYWRRGGD
jgi:uncharacterized protein YbbK (DUF523 family)